MLPLKQTLKQKLQRNLPIWERVLRLCLAVVIGFCTYYFLIGGLLKMLLLISAIILASTALIGFCPAWVVIGRKVVGLKK